MIPPESRTQRAADWVYSGIWQVLAAYFRVPQTPPMLPGRPDEVDAFKPALGFVRYLKFWFWIITIVVDLLILIGWVSVTVAVWWLGLLLAIPALLLAIVPDIIGYLAIHLRYDTTWYVMTDRSLRIRRGIWTIHEMTITFENVQNVKVQQGPIQRMLGISNLIVETAGSGGDSSRKGGAALNQGIVEGVHDAWALRDRVLARLKTSTAAGVGDEDKPSARATPTSQWRPQHVNALRAIRDELALMVQYN